MLKNKFDHKQIEERWKVFWEKQKIYRFDTMGGKGVYAIDNPPPTVSGDMHIGHAFQYSQQDFVARFHRMKGEGVFYPFGTDDNGLPTERLVERLKNVKSKDMTRAEFIELCLKTLKEITPKFIQDWKDIGVSADYGINYSTIDDNSRKISQAGFLELARKGIAYKEEFPTIWCPECQTAIAQAELEDKEMSSEFSTLKFKCGKQDLLIATTRPELLGACVAVFVNPDDKKYKKFVGKNVVVPLFGHEVQVIADESANMEKGTGALMVCSYGDKYDVEVITKLKLKPRIVFDKQGRILEGDYRGLKAKEARKKILEDLEKAKLVTDKKNITHVVNVHDKCGTGIEFLPTEQWFIKILDKKDVWLEQGKRVNWRPELMYKRYKNWVNGLEWNWNISRDRHFGVPIPVWYCVKCKETLFAEDKELPVDPLQIKKRCPKCGKNTEPEEKVLDTWATSSLTPQIIGSLIKDKIKIPYSLRTNAHDIIRTWDFYTIVRSYLHEGKLPWENIMVSGFVKLKGEKMSKSKGNVVSPRKIMEEYGADALRFWASSYKLGDDLDYQDKEVLAGKRFITKLLNASNFVFMNLKGYRGQKPKKLEVLDQLFLDELNIVVENVTRAFENYEPSKAKAEIDMFFWKMFCDNYLEVVKKRVYQGKGQKKLSAQYTLYKSLLTIVKMMAPIMSFITEEIYQEHFKKIEKDKSVHISKWPEFKLIKKKDIREAIFFNSIVELISKIRQEKTKSKKPMNAECFLSLPKKDKEKLKDVLDDLKDVMNIKDIKEGKFKVEFL
ncbi:MAG: valine--tRNA ligase [Nanoarchaeota archaeon]|nr:valine--tRNA ligase [Nanoarchaeota archaeon]